MSEIPLPWITKIEQILTETKKIPLWGFAPSIPFEALAKKLEQTLQVAKITLSHHQTTILESKPLQGFGEQAFVLALELPPLSQKGYWVMTQENIGQLARHLLSEDHTARGFFDHTLKEGFYYFLALKVLETIRDLKCIGDLSIQLVDFNELPKTSYFAMDIELHLDELTLWGRWLCPEELQKNISEHFSKLTPSSLKEISFADLDVTLAIEIGQTQLAASDLDRLHLGDLLLLDRCSLDLKQEKSMGQLTLHHTPLFQLRLKPQEIKIVDYIFFEESDISSKEDWEEEEISQEESINQPSDLLTVSAELTYLNMPLHHLLQLKPGNSLDFVYSSGQPIHLTVKGKSIAHAELVKVGDVMGAKILKLE